MFSTIDLYVPALFHASTRSCGPDPEITAAGSATGWPPAASQSGASAGSSGRNADERGEVRARRVAHDRDAAGIDPVVGGMRAQERERADAVLRVAREHSPGTSR